MAGLKACPTFRLPRQPRLYFARVRGAEDFAVLGFGALEEGGEDDVADEAHDGEGDLGVAQKVLLPRHIV
ncbi:MAG: hypothetical protein AMXMBFR57_20120 [Acidimicrobiia bacterium]